MHREIEERLIAGPDRIAVIPLPTRPGDALVATSSRIGGWMALGGGIVAALALIIR